MVNAIRAVSALVALLFTVGVYAATEVELEPSNHDPDNVNSLQRGNFAIWRISAISGRLAGCLRQLSFRCGL